MDNSIKPRFRTLVKVVPKWTDDLSQEWILVRHLPTGYVIKRKDMIHELPI